MALTTVQVHGQILHPVTNTPATGRVTFDTLIPLRDVVDNIVYVRQTFVAPLDANGEFTITLPATDNANLVPASWVYQVWVDTDALDEVFYVQIPFQLGTVEFADLNHVDYDPCGPNPGLSPIAPVDGIYVLRSGDTMLGVLTLDDGSPAASEAWVLANAPGGVPSNTVVTETSFGQASTAGVSAQYSRGDHTHGTPAAPAVPSPANSIVTEQTFGQAASFGVLTTYAREDHTHGTPNAPVVPGPAATVVTEQAFGQASATGVATTYAREDHTHGTPAAPAVPAAGNTVVTETAFGQASTAGVSASYSRTDHTHGTPAAPAVPTPADAVVSETSFGQAAAVGVNTTEFAREDHTHGTPAAQLLPLINAPAVITTGTINVVTGSATQIGTDLTLAAVAGDRIEVGISVLCSDTGGEIYWNVATRVGGADVNYLGNESNTWPFPQGGISGWFTPVNIFTGPRGSRPYTLVGGDISAGTVTVRIYARADNSARDVFATAAQPLKIWLINWRQ